jgi:hypothetical protein
MNPYVVEETFLLDELARRAKQVLVPSAITHRFTHPVLQHASFR